MTRVPPDPETSPATGDDVGSSNTPRVVDLAVDPVQALGSVLLDRYRLDALLFEGASQVYLAWDLVLDGRCVVKIVAGERECARLRREVDIATHCGPIEGLVRFRDHEQQDAEGDEQAEAIDEQAAGADEQAAAIDEQAAGTDEQAEPVAYAVMDYLEGETLHERLKRGLLSEEEALVLGIRTGEILCRLHARGIIHRDIKPENLFLGQDGRVWVLDLGIAKWQGAAPLTVVGQMLGTLPYLPPEQLTAPAEVDERADVYALGMVLGHALGGLAVLPAWQRAPIREFATTVAQRRKLGDVMPSVSKPLAEAVEQACSPDPAGRFPGMVEFVRVLCALADAPRLRDAQERAQQEELLVATLQRRYHVWQRATVAVAGLAILLGVMLLRGGRLNNKPPASAQRMPAPPAVWDEATAREQAGHTASAAVRFDQAAAQSSAWHNQAEARARTLRGDYQDQRRVEQHMLDKEQSMHGGGPIPSDADALVAKFPGPMRRAFYDGVRSATDEERVLDLLPLGLKLDRAAGNEILVSYAKRILGMSFATRAPLAKTYARLVADYNALDRAAQDRYFQALRRAGQDDLLLGALILTDRVGDHLAEFQRLADASGDPWLTIHALHEQGLYEHRQGHEVLANQFLLTARDECERHQIAHRCLEVDYSLAYVHRMRQQLAEAEVFARRGWQLAQTTGRWKKELKFLIELQAIARLGGDAATAEALAEEIHLRDPENCVQRLSAHTARADALLDGLDADAAYRELSGVPLCGQPLSPRLIGVAVQLDRVGKPILPWTTLRAEIVTLRQKGQLSPGEQVLFAQLEGLLVVGHDREEGRRLLRLSIAVADRLKVWDSVGVDARMAAYEELALDAARAGDHGAALLPIAQSMGLDAIPACSLVVVISYERALVIAEDVAGHVQGRSSRLLKPIGMEVDSLLLPQMRTALQGCRRISVYFTDPSLRRQSKLFSEEVAWAYRAPRPADYIAATNSDFPIIEVRPTSQQASPSSAQGSFRTQTWKLRGNIRTESSSSLDGSAPVNPAAIAAVRLKEAPLVLWRSPGAVPRHLLGAYIQAGARGVLVIGAGGSDEVVDAFVIRIVARIQAGTTLTEGLRDERVHALKDNPATWIKDIIALE